MQSIDQNRFNCIVASLVWVFVFSYRCVSVFICGFKRVPLDAGNELSGWLLF